MSAMSDDPVPQASLSGRPVVGVGRVLLWSGGSLWIGRQGGVAQAHSHHAIQITLALTGSVRLCHEGPTWRDYTGAVVMAHHRHQFDGCGNDTAMIFVEPETVQGQALKARFGSVPVTALPEDIAMHMARPLHEAFREQAEDATLVSQARESLALLTGAGPLAAGIDPRIERAIAWMRSRLNEPTSLEQAAAQAHLSPSRFRHLFMEQTGVSFRAYLLWARVELAVGRGMSGQPWTAAAHEAGFADSAHLSRTCRRMFGIAPSMLVRVNP
ncbi:AraC family transcriptional regulator [Piscinibacter sp. XHJ-5]|uniref:AraC family transcriptional regulator n=1 Tax=Piscinibacter sp. XHJ-5 TaxID=3037797 RepID=UPI002452BBA5|nr:AraC family transcriptional regulator [Piscinibacter sp. XHJ-5]